MKANSIDVALTYMRGLPARIATATVAFPRPHVILPPGHWLEDRDEVTLQMLRDEGFIQLSGSPVKELILDLFAGAEVEPNILFASTNYDHVRPWFTRVSAMQ